MIEFCSDLITKYGHPSIIFLADDTFEEMAIWLRSYLEDEVRRGVVFHSGETLQIGWMILMIKARDSNTLELWEPDFDSIPIQWTRTVNNTIRHLLLQKSICEQLGADITSPSLMEAGIVTPNFLQSDSGFVMSRDTESGNDSGWVFYMEGNSPDESHFCSLYEIALQRPSIIPFLALPSGSKVIHLGSDIEVTYARKSASSSTNCILKQISETTDFV